MSLGTILIIVLVLFLIGGSVPWQYGAAPPPAQPGQPAPQPGYWHGYGYGPSVPGGAGLVLLIVLILVLFGMF